jgi:DNA-binding transcriptional regulator YiaG
VPPKTDELLARVKEWCDAKYGRRSELARALGTTPQAVTNWFAKRKQPTAEQVLLMLEFLKHRPKGRG